MKSPIIPMACTLFASAAVVHAEPGDVSWELLRPSNTGVPGDITQTIFIDHDDTPWIAGYITFWEEGGISHFDGTNWRVLGNVDCPQIGNQLGSPRFNDVVKTSDGIMWIGSDQGLLRFDPSVEPWCVERFHVGNSGIAANSVNSIEIAPDGTLWLACDTFGSSSRGGLSQYDASTNTWNTWDTSNGLPWWSGWDWVDYLAVQPDAGGGYTVWFGSSEMGMTSYKDGLFIWYGSPTPPPGNPRPTGVPGKNATLPNGDMLVTTTQGLAFRHPDGSYDIVGSVPTGTAGNVSIIEPVSGNRVLLGTFGADVYLWDGGWSYLGNWGSGNHTYALAEDSKGAFWAGGIGGSSKYENGQWQRYRLTNTGMLDYFIGDVSLAPNGDVAMTANAAPGVGGFDIMHADRTWTNANVATYGLGLDWPYPTDNTSAVEYRQNGNLLFSPTNNGLREYDGESFSDLITQTYDFEYIGFTGSGRGWAATGRGVAFREDDDGGWDGFFNADGLPVGDINGIVADPHDPDAIWIGAQFGVAKTTDGVSWDEIPREAIGLSQNSTGYFFYCFDIADDGTFWFGSGRGLFHYDPATGNYENYTPANSPLPSDDVHNVEIAPDGSVWISMFDQIYPYPGGVAQFKDGAWRVWQQPTSPLPHNQINDLESRVTPEGYEIWVATASEAIAIISIEGNGTQPCPADLNGDGMLDFFDVSAFLNAFNAGDPLADLTGDGNFDFFDVSAFLNAFGAGCP